MTWSDFYLICFAVGFCFSFFSFVFGGSRFGKLHLPHFHGHAWASACGARSGSARSGRTRLAQAQRMAEMPAHGHHGATVSPFNPPSFAAFLAWFGGTGYLLTRFSACGSDRAVLVGARRLVGGRSFFLPDQDADVGRGVSRSGGLRNGRRAGQLSVPIREGGTGEMIYSQVGTRRVCGARSENGGAIAKGTEVVVTRYEKGIAYVRLWSEMSGELDKRSIEGPRD